jgi:integral membrane protein (TIGR01906 family)
MKKTLYSFSMVLIMVFTILFSVFTVVNTNSFYSQQYRAIGADETTGVSLENLDEITTMLLDYLNDRRDNLDMQVEKWGVMKQVFDERETSHMVDVKNLYAFFAKVMYATFIVAAVIMVYLFRKDGKAQFFANAVKGYKSALIIAVILCVIFATAFTVGFNTFWTLFHQVMFTNDLWLLDPNVSVLINMVPLQFFFDLVTKIVVLFIAFLAGCSTLFLCIVKKVVRS